MFGALKQLKALWAQPEKRHEPRPGSASSEQAGSDEIDSDDSSTSSDQWGIKALAEPSDAIIDIVAIHGLNGDREKTWTAPNGAFWLNDWLPQAFPKARILTYGYDARTHGSTALSEMTLNKIGLQFLSEFCLYRRDPDNNTTRRPIIFLAHSLGGIVLKSALLQSENRSKSHIETQRALKLSTYGIIFFGTPHSGGNGVSLGEIGLKILSLYHNTNDKVLKHLQPHSEWLMDQVENFKNISKDFQTIFCYETLKTPLIGKEGSKTSAMVVPEWSAIVSGLPNVEALAIRKNHRTMVQFKDSEDNDYVNISRHLRAIQGGAVQKVLRNWAVDQPVAPPSTSTEKETVSLELWFQKLKSQPTFTLHTKLPSPTNIFVGREEILSDLHTILEPDKSQVVVLHGFAGSGKTEIALRYANLHSSSFVSVLWITSTTLTLVQKSFVTIAQLIIHTYATTIPVTPPPYGKIADMIGITGLIDSNGLIVDSGNKVEIIVEAVIAWLNDPRNGPWLLIFDNYDEPRSFPMREYFPKNMRGKILVTTRLRDLGKLGRAVEVDSCSRHDAIRMFQNSCQRSSGFGKNEAALAEIIIEKLGYNPLAIDHAGSYIFIEQVSLSSYYHELDQKLREMLKKKPLDYVSDYEHSVFSSFNISFERILASDPEAAEVLLSCSFYVATEIPLQVIQNSTSRNGASVTTLFSHSLIKRSSDDSVNIHPLLHSWAREKLDDSEKTQFSTRAFRNIMQTIRIKDNGLSRLSGNWSLEKKCMIHVEQAKAWALQYQSTLVGQTSLLCSLRDLALIYRSHGKYKDSEDLYSLVLNSFLSQPGASAFEVAMTRDGLARVKSFQGQKTEAAQLFEDAKPQILDQLGPQSREYLLLLSGLGNVRLGQGRLEDAIALYKPALHGFSQIEGSTGVEYAGVAACLSQVYKIQGKLKEAETLSLESVNIMLTRYGSTHPTTMKWKQVLATILEEQGRFDEAKVMYEEVLKFRTQNIGEIHPSTLRTIYNLAGVHVELGQYSEAESLARTCLIGRQAAYDADHTMILRSLEQFGQIMYKTGRYEEANTTLEEVRKKFLSVHRSRPLAYFSSVEWLARTCIARDELNRGESLYQEVVQGYSDMLGVEHARTKGASAALQGVLVRLLDDEGLSQDEEIISL